MPLSAPTVKVTTPVDNIPVGRGFYQLEEDALYIPIESPGGKPRFFSYLDADTVSLQLDKDGRLIFIEVTLPRRRWQSKKSLVLPENADKADLRFLDFRDSLKKPNIICDKTRENIMLRFMKAPAERNFHLAENVIAQVDADDHLVAVWAFNLIDDLAGREISSWRKALHKPEPDSVSA